MFFNKKKNVLKMSLEEICNRLACFSALEEEGFITYNKRKHEVYFNYDVTMDYLQEENNKMETAYTTLRKLVWWLETDDSIDNAGLILNKIDEITKKLEEEKDL